MDPHLMNLEMGTSFESGSHVVSDLTFSQIEEEMQSLNTNDGNILSRPICLN